MLVGDPVRREGLLAWNGRQTTGLLPQVFMLLWHLAKSGENPLTAREAIKLELIKPRHGSPPNRAFCWPRRTARSPTSPR